SPPIALFPVPRASFRPQVKVVWGPCRAMPRRAQYERSLRVKIMVTAAVPETKTMRTLPGDAVRQIQWRFADRFDLQMLVQSARTVARGTVARLVAAG